jgi:hypothetical protein
MGDDGPLERQGDTGPIARLAVGGEGAPMPEGGEAGQSEAQDGGPGSAAGVGDEADAAGVVLEARVVERWAAGGPPGGRGTAGECTARPATADGVARPAGAAAATPVARWTCRPRVGTGRSSEVPAGSGRS